LEVFFSKPKSIFDNIAPGNLETGLQRRINMKRVIGLFAVALVVLAAGIAAVAEEAGAAAAPKPDKDGFYSLFDGKTLDGWKVGANANSWKVKDGMIVVHGPGPSHLFYEGPVHQHDFKDFHFKAKVMTFPHANSGIYFDTKYQAEDWPNQGFEAQVNATHEDWKKTGSLYDVVNIPDPHHKDKVWFLYEIIVKGNHVVLKVDGKPPEGHPGRFIQHGTFALQGHDPGSQTYFKDIMVKPLDE
jgi:hypothetical protein